MNDNKLKKKLNVTIMITFIFSENNEKLSNSLSIRYVDCNMYIYYCTIHIQIMAQILQTILN